MFLIFKKYFPITLFVLKMNISQLNYLLEILLVSYVLEKFSLLTISIADPKLTSKGKITDGFMIFNYQGKPLKLQLIHNICERLK